MTVAGAVGLALLVGAILSPVVVGKSSPAGKTDDAGWTPLFNGKDLTGWKMVNPPSGQFQSVQAKANPDGKVVAYVGTLRTARR